MLKNSFQHIPGIGEKTEQQIWDSGLTDWQKVFCAGSSGLPPKKRDTLARYIGESQRHLADNNPGYFSDRLPSGSHWRMFPEFRESTAFIDIETTGLEAWDGEITTIAPDAGTALSAGLSHHPSNQTAIFPLIPDRQHRVGSGYREYCGDRS